MTTSPKDAADAEWRTFDAIATAVVIVTFNRSQLLSGLLTSISRMDPQPGRVIVVDNASTDNTAEVVEAHRGLIRAELVHRRLESNTGGAGGFSEGVRMAFEVGAEWIWMMDDDVEVIEDALARLGGWAPRFDVIQGRRYDFDGSEFYWQYRIADRLAIPIPFARSGFDDQGYREMNSGCFEGMFIHRDVVAKIGLPDPRFFIYWDDQMYGWLASRVTTAVIVDEFVLRRTREIVQWDMGIRHFNASSDRYRYFIMRNRAYLKHYYRAHGVWNPVLFGLGTALTFAKEILRLLLVERTHRGTANLFRGIRDGVLIARDRSWVPMPPLHHEKAGAPLPGEGGAPAGEAHGSGQLIGPHGQR